MDRLIDVISGFSAGIATVIVCSPLDTVRTRLALMKTHDLYRYRGILDAFFQISRNEGISSFYKALKPSLLGYCLSWGIYFPLYNGIRSHLSNSKVKSDILGASIAGVLSSVFTNPVWMIRTRMQAHPELTHSMKECYLQILRTEGIWGFYKGISASLLGVVHVIVYFPLYEQIKRHYHKENTIPTWWQMCICSSVPKIVASACSYPHEVMRGCMYTNSSDKEEFNSLATTAKYIFRNSGIRGFYAGFFANVIRIIPSTFIAMYTYELTEYYLRTNY